jgi:hypothetical protein
MILPVSLMAELVNWAMSILVSIFKAHNLDIKSWRLHPGYGVVRALGGIPVSTRAIPPIADASLTTVPAKEE